MTEADKEIAESAWATIPQLVKSQMSLLIKGYCKQHQQVLEQRREEVQRIFANYGVFKISDILRQQRREKKIVELLKTVTGYSNEEACFELSKWYNPARKLMEEIQRKAGWSGEFPDLPISYIKHNLTLFPLKSRDENDIRSIITDGFGKFHINNQAFADYVVSRHFPELSDHSRVPRTVVEVIFPELADHPRVPSTFVETILDQSVELWGKSVRDVYFARKWLLLEVVLKETLDRLRDKVPCYGYSDWEHEIFVQQYMALREPVYRELANLAMRVPERREMGERPLYSYEKLGELHKKISGKTSLEKWCNTFGVELAGMREYFNTLIR